MKTLNRRVLSFLCLAVWIESATLQAEPVLYTTDTTGDNLVALSLTDGSGSVVGPFGSADVMGGLAYDAVNGVLYGSDAATGTLYSVNPSTGAATSIGSFGVQYMQGLAFSNATGTLYGTAFPGGGDLSTSLYSIDTTTGAATPIGNTGFDSVGGLAIHPVTDVLYGATGGVSLTGSLITLNPATGAGTLVADDVQRIVGLAFHPNTNVLYGIDNGISAQTPDSLYTIDLDTGAATLVGETGVGNNLGLEFARYAAVPEPSMIVGLLSMSIAGLIAWLRRRGQS